MKEDYKSYVCPTSGQFGYYVTGAMLFANSVTTQNIKPHHKVLDMNFVNKTIIDHNVQQNTLKRKIHFSGVGVHNGRAVSMSIEPADINTGIVFERTDIKENNRIKAVIDKDITMKGLQKIIKII